MSTRSVILDSIVTDYVVVVSKYVKIYKMPSFVELIKKQVLTTAGRELMLKRLLKISLKAGKHGKKEIENLITKIEFYETYVD